MALSDTTQPTTRAILTGAGRIDIIAQQTASLSVGRDALAYQPPLPLTQSAARALPPSQLFGGLWKRQALEHQHRVICCPFHKVGGGLLAEGARAVALPAAKPFQQAAHRARI